MLPPALPAELWRCIIHWATEESACLLPPNAQASFGWPYHPTFDASFFRSLATKCNLALVSRQFSEIGSEFLYETLHFRRPTQLILLAQQCKSNSAVVDKLQSWTKTLHVTPVFDPVTTEEDVEEIEEFLRSMLEIIQFCPRLQSVLVQADSVTLFREPTYQPWVLILSLLPSGLHHLAVENFLLGPVSWNPPLFSSWGTSSVLRTLRLDAHHPPFEHHFPHLTHLWLFSWSSASQWDMPALTHLYIDYFPGNETTATFWLEPKPCLKLLHFGGDTDFGLYYPDLPQRLQECTPNLKKLEYHCSGDLDVRWDPNSLSKSIKEVTLKLEDGEFGGIHRDSPLSREDILLHYTAAGFEILLELLTELCPSGASRWMRIERHLEKYSPHPAKLCVLLPRRAAILLQNNEDPPPLIQSSRIPITPR
ncbi:uncharacterized protein FOMMEDRAFT_144733 [Fomitiporia mediterranea MF3/22]|uniref:uncharacterized protein n=1 Tax=Fomitiporia mediterranea (strain MF3/22) TaxID=694068 RepID=UPI0004407AE2|nr:uncharacterized protein FOMMEDRAFT_144733 [Fomitiporia mediterranea MF3/22]EJD06868.1 hypothetical protein FOMMEDRAFT_144733 [Fomitiporia mediterranea MF3/22]